MSDTVAMPPMPCFLDVEASSLDMDSYPIEIAWSDPSGAIESHLINPYAVEDWTDWDYNAQQIHGISRKQCREEGVHPRWLCSRMDQVIQPGEILYADGVPFDSNWIEVLYSEGSALGYAQFKIIHSDVVMLPLLMAIEHDDKKRWQKYEMLKLEARKTVKGRHRAGIDVQYLIELWKLCLKCNENHQLQ
jgi:hypothetical protein